MIQMHFSSKEDLIYPGVCLLLSTVHARPHEPFSWALVYYTLA